MAEYAGRLPLFHVDLYRLADARRRARRRPDRRAPGGRRHARRVAGAAGPRLPAERLDVVIDGSRRRAADDHAARRRRATCGATSRPCRDRASTGARPSSSPSTRPRRASSSRSGRSTADARSTRRRGRPATATARRCCRRSGAPRRAAHRPRAGSAAIVVGTGPGRVHRAAGRARDGQGPGPRARHADRRRLDRRGPARGRGDAADGRSLLLPAGPSDRLARPPGASPRAAAGRHGARPRGRRDRSSPSTWTAGPRPTPCARGEARPRRTRRPRCISLGARRASRAGDARRPRPARARIRDPAARRPAPRAGRWHGRATPGEAAHRADAARGPAGRPRHRAGQLRRAVAAPRLPERARDEPAGPVPRRPGRRRDRRLRRDVADGRRGATSPRSPSTRPGGASASASGCCSRSSTSPSSAARTRRRSRSACPTSPARRLYEKYGFRPVGLRPRYYSDDNEDALIMTTEPLAEPPMRERIAAPARRPRRGAGADPAAGRRRGARAR